MLLIAVDPGGCAWEVVEEAATLAAALGESATLMTSVQLPDGVSADTPLTEGPYAGHSAEQVLVTEADRELGALASVFERHEVPVTKRVEVGPCVEAILGVADELRPRMLVLGTHGRRGIRRFFLGSVAEQVIRRAEVPVLTVRSRVGVERHATDAEGAVAALADG